MQPSSRTLTSQSSETSGTSARRPRIERIGNTNTEFSAMWRFTPPFPLGNAFLFQARWSRNGQRGDREMRQFSVLFAGTDHQLRTAAIERQGRRKPRYPSSESAAQALPFILTRLAENPRICNDGLVASTERSSLYPYLTDITPVFESSGQLGSRVPLMVPYEQIGFSRGKNTAVVYFWSPWTHTVVAQDGHPKRRKLPQYPNGVQPLVNVDRIPPCSTARLARIYIHELLGATPQPPLMETQSL